MPYWIKITTNAILRKTSATLKIKPGRKKNQSKTKKSLTHQKNSLSIPFPNAHVKNNKNARSLIVFCLYSRAMYTTTTSSVEKIMTDGTGSENEIHVLRTG
jgi:hypothetical protein